MDNQRQEELFRAFVARVEKFGDRKAAAELENLIQLDLGDSDEVAGLMFERECAFWDSLWGPKKEEQQVALPQIPEQVRRTDASVQG